MQQEIAGIVDRMESFIWHGSESVCMVCGLKGHDTNLTGNTLEMAMAACVKELRATVVTLTKEKESSSSER